MAGQHVGPSIRPLESRSRRVGRLVFGLAFIGAVSAACSPAFFDMMLAKGGFGHGGGGGGLKVSGFGTAVRADRDTGAREDALRAELLEQAIFGTAQYQRISGRCGGDGFTSEFRFDVGSGEKQPIRFVQSFGDDFRNVTLMRSKRLGMFSDDNKRVDEVYFFTRPEQGIRQGVVVNGSNRSIRGLRNVDVLADSLARDFVRDEVAGVIADGTRPRPLQTAIGAPNNACTMLVTLTPDADSRQFDFDPRPRSQLHSLLDRLVEIGASSVDQPTIDPGNTGFAFDTWVTGEEIEAARSRDFMGRVGLDPSFNSSDLYSLADGVVSRNRLAGAFDAFGSDALDDLIACDTNEPVSGRSGADIRWSAGLSAPDGSTTMLVGTDGSPLATFETDWSSAISWTALFDGSPPRQKINEKHAGGTRQGELDDEGQVLPGTEAQVRVTDSATIFNMVTDAPPVANFIQAFNTPVEGQERSCDSHLSVPSPSRFPAAEAPGADAASVCTPTDTSVCLNNGRFHTQVTFGGEAVTAAASLFDPTASLHGFADDPAMSASIRVVNGCQFNDHYWIEYSDTGSSLQHSASVTDVQTGANWTHSAEANAAPATEWHLQGLPCSAQ